MSLKSLNHFKTSHTGTYVAPVTKDERRKLNESLRRLGIYNPYRRNGRTDKAFNHNKKGEN